jgi:hypothetical protein
VTSRSARPDKWARIHINCRLPAATAHVTVTAYHVIPKLSGSRSRRSAAMAAAVPLAPTAVQLSAALCALHTPSTCCHFQADSTVDEAIALIPSLSSKFDETDIEELLEIVRKSNAAR